MGKYDLLIMENISNLDSGHNPFKGKTAVQTINGLTRSEVVTATLNDVMEWGEHGWEFFSNVILDQDRHWQNLDSGKITYLKLGIRVYGDYGVIMYLVTRSDE